MEEKKKKPNKYKKKENGKNETGRPTVMDKDTIDKLEHAYSIGCTDLEACIYAKINPATLYKYQKSNPEFIERKTLLKQKPVLRARNVIMTALSNNDKDTAKWYLEKRCKKEFGNAVDIDLGVKSKPDLSLLSAEQIKKLAEEAINESF